VAVLLLGALLLLALSGCAPKKDSAWEQDKDLVAQSLQDINGGQVKLSREVERLNMRIGRLEKLVAKQEASISALKASKRSHKRKSRHVSKSSKKKNTMKKSLAKKLDKIETDIQKATHAAAVKVAVNHKAEEKNLYTAAYLALKSGRYDESISSFQALLTTYPKGDNADLAYYWLGEGLLAKGNAKEAIKALHTLTQSFPNSGKYQAGLLKLAAAYEAAKRKGDSKAVLQRLIQEYPDSRAAERARVHLRALLMGKK